MGPGVRRACAASGRSCPGGLLVSYRPLVLSAFSGPREASAEASRAAAGSPRHEIGGEDTTRARPLVVGATNKTPLPRGFRGLCFDHCYYGRFCGPIPRFNFFLNLDSTGFVCGLPPPPLSLFAFHAAPSSRADASVTSNGHLQTRPAKAASRQPTSASSCLRHHHVEARRRRGGSP